MIKVLKALLMCAVRYVKGNTQYSLREFLLRYNYSDLKGKCGRNDLVKQGRVLPRMG